MEPQVVRFVLPPPEEPARRALLGAMEALRASRPELVTEAAERLDLPTLGRMAEGPALVVADKPLALPRGAVGVYLLPGWAVDTAWARNPGHLYAVAHPALLEPLSRLGIPAGRIVPTGLPLASLAHGVPPQQEARRLLGLDRTASVLAILLEGLDAASLDPLLFQLTLLSPPPTCVFFAGEDPLLRTMLRRKVPTLGLDARLLGDARHLAELLAAAELALATTEGVPCAEALAAGLPVLALPGRRATAGEELQFLVEQGAVRPVSEVRVLAAELDLLRQDREARQHLRARGAALLQPEPLAAFLALIQRGIAERAELLQPPRQAPLAEPTPPRAAGERAGGAVLENLAPPPAGAAWEPEPATAAAGSTGNAGAASAPPGRGPALRSLTEPIATEKATRARFEQASAELARWQRRVGLAAAAGDAGLQELAVQEVQRLEAVVTRLSAELELLARHRLTAQRGQPRGEAGSAEERFRQLELEAELRALKRRMEE